MSLDSNATLLPCPFCGCEEIVGCSDDGEHWNMCTGCGVEGPVTTRYSGDEGEEYTSWNSRPRYTALLLEVSELRNHNHALLARSQPSEWVAKVPVEAIEYALATMDLELDYLCSQYSQRPEESGERDTWKRRVSLCKSHIESLRALLPSLPEPLMPKTEAK